ncbi:hypothetical protein VTH06DRAFT_7588 [Thermothelomyces fergusii]
MGLLLWNPPSDAPYPGVPPSSGGPPDWDRARTIANRAQPQSQQRQQQPTRSHPRATRLSRFIEPSRNTFEPAEQSHSRSHHKIRRVHSTVQPDTNADDDAPPSRPPCLTIPHLDGRLPPEGGSSSRQRSRRRGSPAGQGPLGFSFAAFPTAAAPPTGEAEDGSRRRPPSLERQDAFRDERTAKRRRGPPGEDEDGGDGNDDNGEHRQDAGWQRLRLLLADERERGKGFAPDRVVRGRLGGCYRCRCCGSLPAGRLGERERWGEDAALAGRLYPAYSFSMSSSCSIPRSSREDVARGEVSLRRHGILHDGHQLAVIHELAADEYDVSVPDVSFETGKVDGRMVWAVPTAFQAVDSRAMGMAGIHRSPGYAGP